MVFTKRLRDGIRRGRIRCSVRIWTRCHVKAGGRYRMDEGQIVVDSITSIAFADITDDLARESGFTSAKDLLLTAKHGPGDNIYLIRFHYLRPGAWDVPGDRTTLDGDRTDEPKRSARVSRSRKTPTLLERIRTSPPAFPRRGKKGSAASRSRSRKN
jgi:hypothetical protein